MKIFHFDQATFHMAAKHAGMSQSLKIWGGRTPPLSPFETCLTWTLILKLKIQKIVLDVLHFILLPLCGCFTNNSIINSRKSLVVLNEVAFVFFLFSKIYKFSWILAIPFSLKEVIKGITPCVKVLWFKNWIYSCNCWLLHALDFVKFALCTAISDFYHL